MALTKVDGSLISGTIPSSVLTNSGAAQLVANGTIMEHNLTISSNYTISNNVGALSVGPLTINTGIVVTIPTGSRWVIV